MNGIWEFYPGVFLDPESSLEGAPEEFEGIRKYVRVPGSWDNYLSENGSPEGAGTYRLVIKLPEDGLYAIKTKTIRLASRIYLNGQKVIHTGEPSTDGEGFKKQSKYRLGAGNSSDGEIVLLAHISSFHYTTGGIISPIEFGHFDSIQLKDNISRTIDAMGIGVCVVLGLYFLMTFLQRSDEMYLLFFSGMNLFMALYLSVMNEQLLDLVFQYDFQTRTRLQIVGMVLATVCLLQFIHYFLNDYSSANTVKTITAVNLLSLLLIFFTYDKLSLFAVMALQVVAVMSHAASYVYVFCMLIKAIYHRVDFLGYILAIATSLVTYWVLIFFKMFMEIDLGYISTFLISIMLLGVSSLMSHKLQQDYNRANSLSERLAVSDELKDRFLVKASHELKTPLHMILNLTKNLGEGQKGTLNPKQQEDLFFIHQESRRLTRLVGDLLDAAQIKEGNVKFRIDSVKPHGILKNIMSEIRVLIPEGREIVLKNRVPKSFPALRADPDKLTQIIYNLIHNAIKCTEEGEISVSASVSGDMAKIEVSDTGPGIREDDLEEVFNAFYQSNEDTAPKQGLGIGLTIVKYLVEGQGGEVQVRSNYGEGSTFSFSLPLCQKGEDGEMHFPVLREKEFSVETSQGAQDDGVDRPIILVVDDESLNKKILWDALKPLRYHVFFASCGDEAIKIVEESRIDLMILDYMLPDITGDKVCEIVRQKYSMTELPILILTASSRTVDLMNGFECGANDFQRKPLDIEELVPRIQSLLLMKETVETGLEREFQYFYSQISPHFLYNTLNTIIGLSYEDMEKARGGLDNLSVYFRGKLDVHRNRGLIPLEDEFELIRAYLEIEKMRYGDKLDIEYDVDEGLRGLIPPLTLQPIVENAVRHGIKAKNHEGSIKIRAKRNTRGAIDIIIEDDGVGMTSQRRRELMSGSHQSIGFRNVLEKIKLLKGAKIDIESELEKGTRVKITISEVKYCESHIGGR